MDTLKQLESSIALNTIETKMKLSLDEIRTNNPNRTDLIKSLEDSISDIQTVKIFMSELFENWQLECKTSFRLAQANAELRVAIDKREEQIVDLERDIK
ncbi:MAG: hypothetical protein Unbinned221contig1000_29 [Prokaryotic dsDNA virus sp.]|nr:MAG: hypothetical protein Unbinned221contig1000_29 [Prokaryotic dsDNA virus sp.]|tara:strand:+ start:47 stop:343 length:297 start_codon:yes stop_codon:yes gene_type:complete